MSRSIHAAQGESLPYNHHLHQFLTFLKHERGFADATIVNRERSLKPFLGWLVAEDVPLSTVSPVVITKYFTGIVAGRWKRTTVSFHVQSLRSFFRYASSRGWCAAGIAESIDAPRVYTYENVPQVVEEMIALARPGGVVASHEADWGAFPCDPPSPAWDRLVEVFVAYSRNNGIDLFVGRKTHQMFRAAGLTGIQVNPLIHVYPPGHNRRNILCDFLENVKERILAENLMAETEFHERFTELQRHLDDTDTLVISHLFIQVWGKRPRETSVLERSARV